MSRALLLALAAPIALVAAPLAAKVIGQNTPAESLTFARIAALPKAEQPGWRAYLQRSQKQRAADRASLPAELPPGATPPPPPLAVTPKDYNMPLDRVAAWYAGAEARRIADTIVSFQTPAGGWSKNQNRAGPPRLPGQRYANDAETMDPDRSNFDAPEDRFWTFVGTLDNDATFDEMQFLAKVAATLPGREGEAYRASFVKGVRYLLAAQYPNGGWPQIWPLEGGFHDGITFNDNAMAHAVTMLQRVSSDPAYRFVPAALRTQAAGAVRRGVAMILAAQVRVDGRLTGWPQQVDPLTLKAISARNYEPRSIASAETSDVLFFLMNRPVITPEIARAVAGGVAWLKARALYDHAWTRTAEGRKLIAQPGGGALWSRNYDVATQAPIFGDKDKSIHDDVNLISVGRRNGYNWWVTNPARVIAAYPAWARRHGVSADAAS